jgi:formylglycine-generating enzyme required for sulfatase activity
MNNCIKKPLLIALIIVAAVLLHCVSWTSPADCAGSTTQDVTTISGIIYAPDGRPSAGASVVIRASDYLPRIGQLSKRGTRGGFFVFATRTNDRGYYTFTGQDSIPSGRLFVMEAHDSSGNYCLIGDTVISSILYFSMTDSTPRGMFKDTLKPSATIMGKVQPPGDSIRVAVAVYGLDQWTEAASNGVFILPCLPEGRLRMVFIAIHNGVTYDTVLVNTRNGNWTTIDTSVSSLLRVLYDGNGNTAGSLPVDEKKYASGDSVTVLGNTGNLVKTGFTFLGWNTKKDGSGVAYAPGETFAKGAGAARLFAQWKNLDGMRLIKAAGQSFSMGGNDYIEEMPIHTVKFNHDFLIDTTEITQVKYRTLMNAAFPDFKEPWEPEIIESGQVINPGRDRGIGDNFAAYGMTWFDAVLFCNLRTKAVGSTDTVYSYTAIRNIPGYSSVLNDLKIDLNKGGFHLPTEAQWEYACRAGSTTDFYWGSETAEIGSYAIFIGNSGGLIHPVAQKLPNKFGLFDMIGNVSEWCNDLYGGYDSDAQIDPAGPVDGTDRIYRGGDWGGYNSDIAYYRTTRRGHEYPSGWSSGCGFRVCLTIR